MPAPRGPIGDWASPSTILAVAAMALTAYSAYNATQTRYEVRIARLEWRLDHVERQLGQRGAR